MTKKALFLIFTTLSALALGACGGSSNGLPPVAGSSSDGGTYLFYQGSLGFDQIGLAAVDPADPTNPIDVELPGIITNNTTPIYSGTYNSGTGAVSNLHIRTIVYEKSGNLYQVSALKSGSLTPVQVSNEALGTSICDTGYAVDFSNPNNSRFYYTLPGANLSCGGGDDILRMVDMGMTPTDTPVQHGTPGAQVINEIKSAATGGITGWVILKGNQLQKFDANFDNLQLIADSITTVMVVLDQAGGNGLILMVDNGVDKILYRYDTTGTSLGATLHTFTSGLGNRASDSSYVYFQDGNAIYRVPVDGSAASALVVAEAGAGSFGWSSFRLTTNRLVYYWHDTSGSPAEIIRSVPKVGGATTNLDSRTADNLLWITASGGNRVYYNDWDDIVAVSVNADGTGSVEYTDSVWTGWTVATTVPASSYWQQSRVFLLNQTDPANAILSAYDIANYTQTANFGVVPNAADTSLSITTNVLAINNNTLYFDEGSASSDIFFLNTEDGSSLVTVTSNTLDEYIVGFEGCSLSPGNGFDPVFPLLLLLSVIYFLRRRRNA